MKVTKNGTKLYDATPESRRGRTIQVRVTDEEYAALRRVALGRGMTVSEHIRDRCLAAVPDVMRDRDDAALDTDTER